MAEAVPTVSTAATAAPAPVAIGLEHLKVLLHTVGLDKCKVPYRNAYITFCGSYYDTLAQQLMQAGWLDRQPYGLHANHWLYQATEEGLAQARAVAKRRAEGGSSAH